MKKKPVYCYVWFKGNDESTALCFDQWLDFDQSSFHRLDGPAIIFVKNGEKQWWQNGKPHRLDGPAFEWTDGYTEWAIDGLDVDGDEIEKWVEENDVDLTTEEGQMALKLRWI